MTHSIKHSFAIRSDFSIGQSMFQVDQIAARAKELGYESLAIADIMSLSGMVSFTKAMKGQGIKPIIGVTLRVYDDPTYRKPSKASGEKEKPNPQVWLKVFAKSDRGLRSMMRVLSTANTAERFYYNARCGWADIEQLEDVVITTGDFFGLFSHPEQADRLSLLCGTVDLAYMVDLFIEVCPVDTLLWKNANARAIAGAKEFYLPILASYPALYAGEGDADSLDVLRVIATNQKVDDPWTMRPFTRDFYLQAPIEFARRVIKQMPAVAGGALASLQTIADSCRYEFEKLEPCLPKMADDEFMALAHACKAGWVKRFARPVLGHTPAPADLSVYKARLVYEMDVIRRMGFSGYYLLVQDIVAWAKGKGIIVGPGRGSVGGSLIAYLMGITDVDPIRFNLLFERFINPDRIDLPDADLDFMSKRRHEVFEYITEKWGAEQVAGVSNYNTLGAASALRDTARVHGMSPFDYACSKQVERQHGVPMSLEESATAVPDIERFKERHPNIWRHATALEGAMRGMGQHAAGIVVAGEPLVNRAVVETRTGGPVVNWDKGVVESWGLIKIDVLGLSTLDVLDLGRQYVRDRHGKTVSWLDLPLDDVEVLKAFGRGETVGVFQFESPGMRNLLKQLAEVGPLSFDDLVAVVALYRPGPLDAGLCDDYVAIKQGHKRPYYEHPSMEVALKETYGVIVYQEQVMQIARDVAGFTMAEADTLRKIMGKKDKEGMAKQRDKWVAGCVSHGGMTEADAAIFFDKIEVFAGYAFNKSHSVEYAIISWWAMWLKVRYTAEFYAASMSVVDDDTKLAALVNDANKWSLEVLPPDINRSSDKIEIEGDLRLYAPFQAIKGISEKVAGYIMRAKREHGKPFVSAIEFLAVLEKLGIAGKVNVAHRERLVRVGAFAECEGDPIGAMHAERLKSRIELMAGFTVDTVKADRVISADRLTMISLTRIAEDCRTCEGCSLAGNPHPLPRIGKTPKFMIVQDCPSWQDERDGRLLAGEGGAVLLAALKEAGVSPQDFYITSLVKSAKPKGSKALTNEQINGCGDWLRKEIEVLKPPVILAIGAATTKFFVPSAKNTSELVGKVVFDPKLDASIVFGINPLQILFDPSKVTTLRASIERVADLLS